MVWAEEGRAAAASRSATCSLSVSVGAAPVLGRRRRRLAPSDVRLVGETPSPPNILVSRMSGRQDREKVILIALALEM